MTTAKQLTSAIDAAAEAGHDTFYAINASCSDLGYMFETAKCKAAWREVAVAVARALAQEDL